MLSPACGAKQRIEEHIQELALALFGRYKTKKTYVLRRPFTAKTKLTRVSRGAAKLLNGRAFIQ